MDVHGPIMTSPAAILNPRLWLDSLENNAYSCYREVVAKSQSNVSSKDAVVNALKQISQKRYILYNSVVVNIIL